MSNPYDQFDEDNLRRVSTNPYDQFDTGGVAPAPKTNLFSLEGISSTLRLVGPNLAKGILGNQLAGLEEVKAAKDKARARGESVIDEPELEENIRIKQQAIREADLEIEKIRGTPSKPLEIAQGVVSSVASNAPGVAAAVATRNVGPIAAVPALQSASEQAFGSEYATARVGKGGTVEGARRHAETASLAEAGFELMPTTWLIKNLGKQGAVEFAAKYIGRELATELPTTAVQKISERINVEPDKPLGEFMMELGSELVDTALITPFAAGTTSLMARGIARAGAPREQVIPPEKAAVEPNDAINDPLTAPFDEVTVDLPSDQKEILRQEFAQIDPETIDQAQIDEARKVIKEHEEKKDRAPDPQAEVSWTALAAAPKDGLDVGELGATAKQAANAVNYINPNMEERLDRRFSFSTDPEAIGLTPRQIAPKPGTYVLGQESEDRPATYLEKSMQTIEEWRQRWLPQSTIVLSNEQLLSNSALGWHYSMGDNKHLIVPAVLRKMNDPTKFNAHTLRSAFYNLSHEFGHALVKERFYEGLAPEAVIQVVNESRFGPVSEQALAPLPELTRQVIQEYNNIRLRIQDGTLSAEEFLKLWMGPAKLGRDFLGELKVAPNAPAIEVGQAIARRAAQNSTIKDEISSETLRKKLLEDFFSLDEYLAEQMSRYAYARKLDQTSPLGQFLQKALDSLRKFFAQIKGDGYVAPGTSFGEWLDSLPKVSRLAEEKKHLATAKKNAGKEKQVKAKDKQAGTPKKAATTPKAKKAVKKVQHQVRADTKPDFSKKATGMVNLLVRDGTLEKGSGAHERALELVEGNNKQEFFDLIREITGKTVKFELDGHDEARVSKTAEWRADRFRSRFFKSWFGDWENNPADASVVRIGAFEEMENGQVLIRDQEASPPLPLFMSRNRFETGEVYHASTLRGAHFAESVLSEPGAAPASNDVVPVVLNIRNPYIVHDTSLETPLAREIQAQGYDGIVYRNQLDGDFTFVVFSKDQIKILDDRSAYQGLWGVSMELDFDQSTPAGKAASRMFRGVSSFLSDKGPLRRALRRLIHHPQHVGQIQQLAHDYPDLVDLAAFNATNTDYVRYGASQRADPDRILDVWERMAKRNMERVNNAFFKELEEGVNWLRLTNKDEQGQTLMKQRMTGGVPVPWWRFEMTDLAKQKLKELGIDVETSTGAEIAKHWLQVKNSLLDTINEDEQVLFELLALRHSKDIRVFNAHVRELKAQVHALRKQPFFPTGRFGNRMLVIKKGGDVVWREAFESEGKWIEAYERALANKAADEEVIKEHLTDDEYVLMSLPKDFLNTVASELGLSEKELETLQAIARPVKTNKLLKPYDLKRLQLKGYSSDALRSYANFTWHHSNAQAKLLHGARFNLSIDGIRQKQREVERSEQSDFAELDRLTKVLGAMQSAKDYIMAPPNEMQTARGLVSLVYLGLNVKTAILNFYGLVTLWSDSIERNGYLKAHARLAEATKLAAGSIDPTNLGERRKGQKLPPDIQQALDRAIEEGVLSQSYAYHLAGAANGRNLARMPGYQYAHRSWKWSVDAAMYMFRLTELGTRRIAFIAAFKDAMEKNGGIFDAAYKDAVTRVNILQNDYSLGNRVPFMRGGPGLRSIVPMATIFMSFAQHMAFHGFGFYELGLRRQKTLELSEKLAAGEITEAQFRKLEPKWFQWGYGYTARIWLLTLLVAGYEGLPGMENILDLLDAAWRKIGKKPMRQELREMIQAIDGDPVFWSRGLAHDVLGFDVSRSVGFGRFVPGTDVLARSKDESSQELVGSLAFNLMGPTGGLIKFGMDALGDDKSWGEKLTKLPGGIGNIWNSYYWSEHGVRGPMEGRITFEKDSNGQLHPRDLTALEIAGKALGFNPTVVSQNREIMWNQYDAKMYWQGRRKGLKDQYWTAIWQEDAEALADVKKAISEFNAKVAEMEPEFRKMRVTPKELADSVRLHRRQQREEERGRAISRRDRGIYENVRRSYDSDESSP